MKKFAVIIAVAVLAAFAAPAFSATNPFMDVPMNHWAYDAIGQLAAHGILSGYPDGTYKGKQPTTRYEMASALARALAVVDMTKASKQDVEMLKRLVVEFRDELEALGVKVDELDGRVKVLEDRLGGWKLNGTLALEIVNRSANNAADADGDGSINFDEARIIFQRFWGDDDEYHFFGRLRNEQHTSGVSNGKVDNGAYLDRFWVEMPFFGGSRMKIGREEYDPDGAYNVDSFGIPQTGGWTGDSHLKHVVEAFEVSKEFGMGKVWGYLAHSDKAPDSWGNNYRYDYANRSLKASGFHDYWELFLGANLQFTEQFGLDLGFQAFVGDNAEDSFFGTTDDGITYNGVFNPLEYTTAAGTSMLYDRSFNNIWTAYAGLRFDYTDSIGFKAIYYKQKADAEILDRYYTDGYNDYWSWRDYGYNGGVWQDNRLRGMADNAAHWAVIAAFGQDALKFTSLWLEYGQYDMYFWAPQGGSSFFYSGSKVLVDNYLDGGSQLQYDMKYFRVALGQQWNDQIATHIFYYGYVVEDAIPYIGNDGYLHYDDAKPFEVGAGIQYRLNPYTVMGLNYIHVDADKKGEDDDNIIRFRTKVSF